MSKWAICSKNWAIHSFTHFRWATWAIRSRSLVSSEWPEQIAHGRSFLVSDLSDMLTLLLFGERSELLTHTAHQKRGNERFTHFFKKKLYIKHTKKVKKCVQFWKLKKVLNHFPVLYNSLYLLKNEIKCNCLSISDWAVDGSDRWIQLNLKRSLNKLKITIAVKS